MKSSSSTKQSCLVNTAKVVLILSNLIYLVAGSLLIFYGVKLKNSGWLDIFKDQYSWIKDATIYIIIFFGVVVILVAIIGCIGAWSLNRGFLCCYSISMSIAIIIFLLLCICGFAASSKAKNWKSQNYPAESVEEQVADSFNTIYCWSEALYLCNAANVSETVHNYFPTLLPIVGLLRSYSGLGSVCAQFERQSIPGELLEQFGSVCDSCSKAAEYRKYSSINTWIHEKCKPEGVVSSWCGMLLISNIRGRDFSHTPYSNCRESILNIWTKWCGTLGVGALVFTIVAITIVVFSCVVMNLQRKKRDNMNPESPPITDEPSSTSIDYQRHDAHGAQRHNAL